MSSTNTTACTPPAPLSPSLLTPAQLQAVRHVVDKPGCGLFLGMGSGKTIITLTAVEELMYKRYEVRSVLVVATKRIAEMTWTDEIQTWAHTRHLTCSVVLGTPSQRLKALETPADIHVTNHDNIKWLVDHFLGTGKGKKGARWPYDMLVIDELSCYKNHTSQRFKALKRVRPFVNRVVGLTGTPAPNGLEALFSEVYLLDGGERLGTRIGNFRAEYFFPARIGPNHVVWKWGITKDSQGRLESRIRDICFSMDKSTTYVGKTRYTCLKTRLGECERRAYNSFKRDSLLNVKGEEVTAANAAVLGGKLLQYTSGALYEEGDKSKWHEVHRAKMELLGELLEEAQGESVLIAYTFIHERERILQAYPDAVVLSTEEDMERWNRGEIRIALGHPASIGHGLNLQHGGHILVWYGLTWNLEHYQQMNKRLDRPGQKETVLIYHLMIEDTIDQQVLDRLKKKDNTQESLIRAVRAEMKSF